MKYGLQNLVTFSIRDLLFVTVIVALAVAWWMDRSKLAGEIERMERQQTFSFYIGLSRE